MLLTANANERESLFGVLARHWQAWRSSRVALAGLESCGPGEVARIAHDLSLSSAELRLLARGAAESANLLYRRMAGLGLDREALARRAPAIMRDMQKTCALCHSKGRCRRDLARNADRSAWRDYCPNDITLGALAPAAAGRDEAGAAAASLVADDRGLRMSMLGLLLAALAWMVLLGAPSAGLRGTLAPSLTPASTERTVVPICLDPNCLSTQQQSALETLRTVQTQGWSASAADALPQASRIVQGVHAGQALACARLGGTVYYGFMYQDGCREGGTQSARLAGYKDCRPMSGGGACLLN